MGTCTYTPHTGPACASRICGSRTDVPANVLGDWYTLLDLAGSCETKALEKAFQAFGAPLEVLRLGEPHLREVYKCSMLFSVRIYISHGAEMRHSTIRLRWQI